MKRFYGLSAFIALAALSSGCDQDFASTETDPVSSDALKLTQPQEKPSAPLQDGALINWGNEYQLKFVVDRGRKQVNMFILGNDGKTPQPLRTAKIFLLINDPQKQVELTAVPTDNDLLAQTHDAEHDPGSSRFVGIDEIFATNQKFSGTISGMIDGTPYSGDFKGQPSNF